MPGYCAQRNLTFLCSEQYQRLAWDLLKKRIHGQVNKVNVGNLRQTVVELLSENIVRGK